MSCADLLFTLCPRLAASGRVRVTATMTRLPEEVTVLRPSTIDDELEEKAGEKS